LPDLRKTSAAAPVELAAQADEVHSATSQKKPARKKRQKH
jgi:hypothetical protein